MKVQHRINIPTETRWCRCSRVEISGGAVKWELSRTGAYDLMESYQRSPHLQLAEAKDDGALRAFVRAWGPLRTTLLDSESGKDSVEDYRRERDRLAAEIRLVASITRPELRRSALLNAIESFGWRAYTDAPLIGLRHRVGIPWKGDLGFDPKLYQWAQHASEKEISEACAYLVSFLPITDYSLKLRVQRGRHGDVVRAWPGLSSLVDALHWMVWEDVYRERPFQFCAECGALFQSDTKHERLFCSTQCARRKTSREYERRKREKEKKSDGTKKAR